MRLMTPLFVCSIAAFLSGCQLLRPYQGPIAPTPHEWKNSYDAPDAGQPVMSETEASALSTAAADSSEEIAQEPSFEEVCKELDNWWEIFEDPVLNQLEEQALLGSYTLWGALERVIEARAQAQISHSALFPALYFNPSYSRTGSLVQNPLGGFLSGANGGGAANAYTSGGMVNPGNTTTTGAGSVPNVFRFVQSQILVPLDFTYEIDLWSQLNNAYYAQLIRAQAASQAYLSVLLSLTANVAASYFQLRGLDAQQAVIQKNIHLRQDALDINRTRFNAGLVSYLDVSRAELEVARAKSDSEDTRRLRGLQENIIAAYVGVPASVFSIEYNPVNIPPPVIPTGLPSELLCRRPDIAQSERNLAAAYRDIGVAYANFFPSFSLNAALGLESPFASQLFTWKARFWQVGWNVAQMVFDAGKNQANLDYYRAEYREAMANYEETVVTAFKDVEDSLVNLEQYAKQAQDLAVAITAAKETLKLAQDRYDRGLVNYLDVVDAERSVLETEQNAVNILGNRYVSTVLLVKALGGGWGPCETCDESLEH